jgi:hypothetical protein
MDNDARMIRLPSNEALALRIGMPARRTPSEVVGTESTPGGHRRPTDPRSGTGSRKGDTGDYAGGAGCVNKSGAKILLAVCYVIDPQGGFL